MFSAPAAPEPIATATKDINEFDKGMFEGAISIPTIQVNKTKDITLGFIKLKKDCNSNAKFSLEVFDFVKS